MCKKESEKEKEKVDKKAYNPEELVERREPITEEKPKTREKEPEKREDKKN